MPLKSGFGLLQIGHKLENDNDFTIGWYGAIVKLFLRCFVYLAKLSYWSKFHVNIITGSRVMTIFFYQGLTKNLEIKNTTVWVLSNIWRLGQVRDTNETLLNAAKCQGYSFYHFRVIKRQPTGVKKLFTYLTYTYIKKWKRF